MREKWRGCSNLTRKKELKRILELTNAKYSDVFCDLGCGEGLLCLWAARKLTSAIGIEDHKKTFQKAQRNKKKFGLSNVKFINKSYDDLEKIPQIKKVTIFFCTNTLDYGFYLKLQKFIYPKKINFVSQYFAPYPIMSKLKEDWYFMKTPFKIAKNEKEWISFMLGKSKTRKDLLKEIHSFSDYKSKKQELLEDIEFIKWLCKRHN